MTDSHTRKAVAKILSQADVAIDGTALWDIQVHNAAFFGRVLTDGSLALGESYMDEWWDCKALDQFFDRILRSRLDEKVQRSLSLLWNGLCCRLSNRQNRSRAFEIGKRHYDIGNDLFRVMLDKGMNYSCGYWEEAATLDEAQKHKLDLICRKLGLTDDMKVLDIGCGWGDFAMHAAGTYGVDVVGITVSEEQLRLAQRNCRGLPVQIHLMDYRELNGTFDRIVCVGMFEHVGQRNYRTYMNIVQRCLAPDGLFLLHTIGTNRSVPDTDPWINKYIFPNSMLPSAKQITRAAEGLLVLEDWHSFGHHYDTTLMSWHRNFTTNWDRIKTAYDRRFYRMWSYYLLSCAGSFRARRNQLWQIVFSKEGIQGGYARI